jgi:hypothetical protein
VEAPEDYYFCVLASGPTGLYSFKKRDDFDNHTGILIILLYYCNNSLLKSSSKLACPTLTRIQYLG